MDEQAYEELVDFLGFEFWVNHLLASDGPRSEHYNLAREIGVFVRGVVNLVLDERGVPRAPLEDDDGPGD